MSNSHVSIQTPADSRWLPLLRDGIRSYVEAAGFSSPQAETILSSTMEACEKLILVAKVHGEIKPFSVALDLDGESIVVDIEYSADIPLNPFQAEEYEVPEIKSDLEEVDPSALWLFLIKQWMDRVFFRVRGHRRVLSMMLYRREKGQEKQAWIMSVRPELRHDLQLDLEDNGDAHPSSTLQKVGGKVLLLDPSETFFVRNMDGIKTFYELYMAHVNEIGLVSPDLLTKLYERLQKMDMLADGDAGQPRWKRRLYRIINLNLSIPKADALVTAVHKRTRFFFTSLGLALLLFLGLSSLIPLANDYSWLVKMITGLEGAIVKSPQILLLLYLLSLTEVFLHELGHGVVCKHYGGHIPRMGVMFYLGMFVFFCDTSAAYTFPSKRQRILVSLGGPIVSFAIFGLGLWGTWAFSGGDSVWGYAFALFTLTNAIGLVMNFNPFIKMDAYYMLLDYTGVLNLRERSFKFLKRKLLGWLGFGEEKDVKVTHEENRLFWWYGLLGGVATIIFFAMPFVALMRVLEDKSYNGGWLLMIILVCVLLLLRLTTLVYEGVMGARRRDYELK